MSVTLEPVTRQRLNQFRRRWQTLEVAKGFAVALLLGLAFLLVVIIVDATLVVPTAVRWMLSATIYGVLLAALVSTWLRVGRGQQLTATARQFEQLDTRLEQRLLSAVELSEDTVSNNLSSASFRARIQSQVASLIAQSRIAELLPWSSIARGVVAALLSLVIMISLAWVPGLHWPHRVARALLPGANLGRISRFDVKILQPSPASTLLPDGSVVAIEASVSGPLPESVMLETRTAGELDAVAMRGITRVPVAPTSATQATATELTSENLVYTANVTIGQELIEYRVVAEDAHSPWYQLTSRPRPSVEHFAMRVVHPTYTQLLDTLLESDVGDVDALRGSRVQLQLLCNQSISQAWLSVSLPDTPEPKKIPLESIAAGQSQAQFPAGTSVEGRLFQAELPVDSDFTYRVHLESADTHFTNAFSSEYQVHALVDDSPQLVWIAPEGSMVVVEPNQLVRLELESRDELPIAEALLINSLNGEAAVTSTIDLTKSAELKKNATKTQTEDGKADDELELELESASPLIRTPIVQELDLLKLDVRVGDTLRVAVQVKDRAGQVTISSPIEMIVSSAAIDPERGPATAQRIELAAELRKFAEQVQPDLKQLRQLHQTAQESGKLTPDERNETWENIKKISAHLAEQTRDNAAQLRQKIEAGLKQPQDSVSLSEIERTGQVLARIESQLSPELASLSELLDISSISPEKANEAMNKLRGSAEKLGDSVSVIDRRFREFVAYDVLSEVARGMRVIKDYQQELVAGAQEESPAQLKRRQAVVARQLRELEQVMVDRSPLLREQGTHGLRSWIEWSGQLAERIERAAADPDDNPNFKEFSKQILNEVKQHQTVMSVDGGLDGEILNGRRELDARSEASATALGEVANLAAEAARNQDGKLTPAQRDQWNRDLQMLQHRKEMQQARGDADSHHVSDLGNAIRATRQLMDTADNQLGHPQAQSLQKTAGALKKLEAIHNFNEANKHLADLEQTERWNSTSIEARTESPRTWEALKHRIEQTARALREAGVDHKVAEQVDRVRYDAPANDAGQKIQARRWSPDAEASAENELAQMRAQMDAAKEQLDMIARSARVDLMEVAPSVSQLARKAADKTSQLQQQTDKLAKSAAADEVPDLRNSVKELGQQQEQASQPINDLRDALTEMAATQDLLDDAQRAIARDADTSQQIIDQASEQVTESMKPVKEALTSNAAAAPLEKAAQTQGEARQALEQIASHFERLQSGDMPASELADSRQALKEMANDMDMAAMDEWYKTAESLSKLAGGDPQQVLKKLEEELNRNSRMREELSDIAKKALDESVKSLAFSADQERTLQSQLEQSDPAYAARKQLLHQDIQAANERMHQWMQQLSNEAQNVTGRTGSRQQQQELHELQQQMQQAIADASAAHSSLPLEDLQRVADAVVKTLQDAQQEYQSIAGELKKQTEQPKHASEQELKQHKREMEDWERRILQQQARGAQSIERAHEQRARQADNATRNAESLKRNAERTRDEVAKQLEAKPEALDLKQRLLEAQRQVYRMDREAAVARDRETALKDRLALAKQTQQEMTARKPTELSSQNPTAELATRLSNSAATTADAIAAELKKALADTGWMQQLAAAQGPLLAGQQQQGRVEQSVQGVANNLERASRHEQRLDHPKAAERIGQQAARVETSRRDQVHTALDQLTTAAEQARQAAEANASSPEAQDAAPAESSLAARGAVSQAETELRERVKDLKDMLDQPQPEESGPAKDQALDAPAQPSVPLDPKMLARMLDELDRQVSDAESDGDQQGEGKEQSQSTPNEAGKSEDDSNQSSSQQSSPSGKKKNSQTSSMQEASRQLSQQMNRGRSQGRQSTAASRQTGNTADTKAAAPSAVRVLSVDRRNGEDWGKLREQSAEQTVESARQSVAPQYRNSVETYFRVLSERGK